MSSSCFRCCAHSLKQAVPPRGPFDPARNFCRTRVAKIGERSLNSITAPRGVVAGQLECEIDDLWRDSWPTNRISLAENVELSDDEFTMPTQNRIGRHEGREFLEEFVS